MRVRKNRSEIPGSVQDQITPEVPFFYGAVAEEEGLVRERGAQKVERGRRRHHLHVGSRGDEEALVPGKKRIAPIERDDQNAPLR